MAAKCLIGLETEQKTSMDLGQQLRKERELDFSPLKLCMANKNKRIIKIMISLQ